ncbi:flavin mononucleotide hydrolase 1, chloroplatic [Beta vulgaris subsp. vulgaris]|uniref:flavin mononucleotide hydrolase 1, chloroplatic n=1 Tax=Beta vulgaris subsp. vulgaris TaxID=3555 RepID=UPI000901A89A|nr:flavin mononucleotide hydrolase 1, chloroplatic [Beta vulgaris subsp. vulgaris]
MTLFFKPTISIPLNFSLNPPKSNPRLSTIMKDSNNSSSFSSGIDFSAAKEKRKLPILLFDVMDTIVRDPFYQDIPAFFGMSMKELMECKHPTAWSEFEKGLINEDELATKFFKDGRHLDLGGLKSCVKSGYSYLDGIEELLHGLKLNNYEMHAFTNYPVWYQMIEDKLKLSTYLSWTFCSCTIGKQKPDLGFYREVLRYLQVDPGSCIFIDDRAKNVEGAISAGMVGLQFKGADVLRQDLSLLGINVSAEEIKHHETTS